MTKRINIALQGGGAHGAFTWGVLDRLLEDEDIEIAAISGTSAGALNGAALKAGLVAGDRQAAKDNLDWFWAQVGALDEAALAPWMLGPASVAGLVSRTIEYSVPFAMADTATRVFSPYQYGPFLPNPLKRIVKHFRYDKVCADEGPALFVCATNVRSGKIRVFNAAEVNDNVLMASACLPTLFKAIEFKDPKTGEVEAFWDGGYTGNPALFPFFEPEFPDDLVIININPLCRKDLPTLAPEIHNRINEISFNSSLLRELRAIQFVKDLILEGRLENRGMKDVLVHMIADDDLMTELSVATKMIPNPIVLAHLKDAGRRAAEIFLAEAKPKLGVESSVNLREMFE